MMTFKNRTTQGCDDNPDPCGSFARACREFPLDAESMKTTQQWETEHKEWGKVLKRWERKQKHRGEDVIRNPFQSLDFATVPTSYGKMPVDMLHNVPLGHWNYLLVLVIDEVTSLLVKTHTKRLYPLYHPASPPDCAAIASQCEAEPEAEEEEVTGGHCVI
jgi:hypothetical protein